MIPGFTRPLSEKVFQTPATDDNILFKFDSGRTITFAEGSLHSLVTGTTGSGKTTAFILPALNNLLVKGFPGLLIDIKGNMTERVRALAKLCGREKDILEIGVGPYAQPINILKGLDDSRLYRLLETMSFKGYEQSYSLAWYQRGVREAADIAFLCQYLGKRDARFVPTLALLEKIMFNFPLCSQLLEYFKKVANTVEEKDLIKRIESDNFGPCKWAEHQKEGSSTKYNNDFDQQSEWRTRHIRNILTSYAETPGIERGFSSPSGSGLEMEKWIYDEKRIVILRFGPQSGCIGEELSRLCMETFYKAVYARGLSLPPGEYTFLVADEFQDFVDFRPNNLNNDNAFTAKSREFRNILIAATQSLSALLTRGGRREYVECFMNNINNRVNFYSDDSWTQDVASHHVSMNLANLNPAQAAIVKYNQETRKHEYGLEGLQTAYDDGQARLAEAMAMESSSEYILDDPETEMSALYRIHEIQQAMEEFAKFPNLFSQPGAGVFNAPLENVRAGQENEFSPSPGFGSVPMSQNERPRGLDPRLLPRPEGQSQPTTPPQASCHTNCAESKKQIKESSEALGMIFEQLQCQRTNLKDVPMDKAFEALDWARQSVGEMIHFFRPRHYLLLERRCQSGDLLSPKELRQLRQRVVAAIKRQDDDEVERLKRIVPVAPKAALYITEIYGKNSLLELKANLSLAEKELEEGWMEKYDGVRMKSEEEEETGEGRKGLRKYKGRFRLSPDPSQFSPDDDTLLMLAYSFGETSDEELLIARPEVLEQSENSSQDDH
jgi:hypothetical protein